MQPTATAEIEQLRRRAQQALSRQALQEAHTCCTRILSLEPGHADAHFLMGMIAFQQNRIGKALALIDRAVAREPDNAEYLARRGQCLAMMKRQAEALEAAERALAANPTQPLTLDTIGVLLTHAGAHERAVEVLQRAVAAAPDNPQFQFNLASAQTFVGNFAAAEIAFEAAIAARPDFSRAHWALSDLVRATHERNHIERLERQLEALEHAAGGARVNDRLYLCHALAKESEDLGEYSRSLAYLHRGKTAKRATMNWRIDEDRVLFETLQSAFDTSVFEQSHTTCDSSEPIFVTGLPRTGTTLVDRILSSHADVHSAGELQNFAVTLKRMSGARTPHVLDAETIRAAMRVDFGELGQRYVASTRPLTGSTPHFVDKLPMNFFYIGFVALALPKAKIVCLRRHPMDSCLSNYRQLFRIDHPYYSYSYSLEDMADYYVMFDALMRHWETLLPERVYSLSYEDLATDPEAETRRLLDHCGLAWQDAVLDFHANAAPVATASAAQVREPMHRRSIGRWRRYGSDLDALRARLESAGIQID